MDFIFGSNYNDSSKSKPQQRELRTQILLNQDTKKQKQLTPLQKLKLEAKRKLQQQEANLQEDQFSLHVTITEKDHNKTYQRDSFNQFKVENQMNLLYEDHNLQPSLILDKRQQNDAKVNRLRSPIEYANRNKPSKPNPPIRIKQSNPLSKGNQQKLLTNSRAQQSKEVSQIKSAKQISPSKIALQVKPIKSAKEISPSKQPISSSKQSISPLKQSISPQKLKQPKQKAKQSKLEPKLSIPVKNFKATKISSSIIEENYLTDTEPKKLLVKQKSFQIKQTKQLNTKRQPQQFDYNNSYGANNLGARSSLQGELYNSQRAMKFLDKKLISDRLGDSESLIYSANVSEKPQHFLKAVYDNIQPDNQFIKRGVDSTLNDALESVNKLIQQPNRKESKANMQKRIAPKHKDDLKQLQKIDKYRLIKIKEGQVKNKIGNLRNELEKEYFENKNMITIDTSDLVEGNYYAIDHPETLKAQSLIRQIKQRRKSENKHYKEMLGQKKIERERIQQIQKEYEEKFKEQRKEKLKEYYDQKHQERQIQREQQRKKQEQFKQWIKIYQREKPLEEKYEEEMVRKLIIPEIEDRHKKLMQIKADNKPIDFEEINQHEKRYMDYKRDESIRQRAHIESKLENDQINQEQESRYYKGKYRYLVLQSMYEQNNQTDPRDIQRSKKQRQLAYSDQVKHVHQSILKRKNQPTEDTRSLVRRVRNHNGSVELNESRQNQTIDVNPGSQTQRPSRRNAETIDTYAQGLKNLQYVKSHVREKLMNGEQKKPRIELIQVKEKRSYLDELKEKRLHNSLPHKDKNNRYYEDQQYSSILNGKSKANMNDLSTANDVQSLKARVEGMDVKLKRKEQRHKLVRDNESMMSSQLQNEYLDSINAKLKMVHELK